MEAEAGGNPLSELSAFKAFTEKVRDRCKDQPVATEFTSVGAYRVFAI
jgi:hypothetical protein